MVDGSILSSFLTTSCLLSLFPPGLWMAALRTSLRMLCMTSCSKKRVTCAHHTWAIFPIGCCSVSLRRPPWRPRTVESVCGSRRQRKGKTLRHYETLSDVRSIFGILTLSWLNSDLCSQWEEWQLCGECAAQWPSDGAVWRGFPPSFPAKHCSATEGVDHKRFGQRWPRRRQWPGRSSGWLGNRLPVWGQQDIDQLHSGQVRRSLCIPAIRSVWTEEQLLFSWSHWPDLQLFCCFMCFTETCPSSVVCCFDWTVTRVWWASALTSPISPDWWRTVRTGSCREIQYYSMMVEPVYPPKNYLCDSLKRYHHYPSSVCEITLLTYSWKSWV